jgi:hypothetical protein
VLLTLFGAAEAASEFEGALALSITPTLNIDGTIGAQGEILLAQAAPALNLDADHGVAGALALSITPTLSMGGVHGSAQVVVAVGRAKRWWEVVLELRERQRKQERRRERRRLKLLPLPVFEGMLDLELRPTLKIELRTLHEGSIGLQVAPALRMVGEVLEAEAFDAYSRQRREDEELIWIWAA